MNRALRRTPPRGARPAVAVSAVVLAAGRATRMGGGKLLLPVDGRPMVRCVVDAALASGVAEVIVVLGHQADDVREVLADMPVTVVVNPDFAYGMSTSLRAGLGAVDPAANGVVILLADQPFLTSALIDTLIERFASTGKAVVRPSVAGKPANPVLVSSALVPELVAEEGDIGGRRVVGRHAADVCLVPVEDPHELVDIDSPGQYEKARQT